MKYLKPIANECLLTNIKVDLQVQKLSKGYSYIVSNLNDTAVTMDNGTTKLVI